MEIETGGGGVAGLGGGAAGLFGDPAGEGGLALGKVKGGDARVGERHRHKRLRGERAGEGKRTEKRDDEWRVEPHGGRWNAASLAERPGRKSGGP